MRVLSVQHYPTFGGPHNEILRLEPHLNTMGAKTIVATTDEPGTALERMTGKVELRVIPLGRARLSSDPRLNLRTFTCLRGDVGRLRRLIRRDSIDLVKVHGPQNPHGALAARLEGVPTVWVISSTRVPKVFRRMGVALVDLFADAILVNGQTLLRAYPGAHRLLSRAFPYYPPIDVVAFHPPSADERLVARRELGVTDHSPIVGTVANVNPQKGIEVFVRAAAHIAETVADAQFVVVGAIATSQLQYFESVKREAAAAGLWPDRISFLGERPDVSRLLGGFDVKLITSVPESEGTTTTALEAMACGVPVVATDVGAVTEIVQNGTTGLIVPPLDSHRLAERVTELLAKSSWRATMGQAARERAVDHFGIERCAETHIKAYEFALRGRAHLSRAPR